MLELKVKVGKPGRFFCHMCARFRDHGRAFDFHLWTETGTGWGWFTATICETCRYHFTQASLEADAAELAGWRERHPNEEEEAADSAREHSGESPDSGSRWLDPVSDHLTFPRR